MPGSFDEQYSHLAKCFLSHFGRITPGLRVHHSSAVMCTVRGAPFVVESSETRNLGSSVGTYTGHTQVGEMVPRGSDTQTPSF